MSCTVVEFWSKFIMCGAGCTFVILFSALLRFAVHWSVVQVAIGSVHTLRCTCHKRRRPQCVKQRLQRCLGPSCIRRTRRQLPNHHRMHTLSSTVRKPHLNAGANTTGFFMVGRQSGSTCLKASHRRPSNPAFDFKPRHSDVQHG